MATFGYGTEAVGEPRPLEEIYLQDKGFHSLVKVFNIIFTIPS